MDTILKIDHVSKEYRLGAIGGKTLREEIQSWWAYKRHKEDPNTKIGSSQVAYGSNQRFKALDNVSFEVERGEALGIIGHNGAGKSTLLKLISRVTAPTEGKIYLDGTIASMLEVGTGFHPELTGRENVYLNGAILGMSQQEINKKFDQIVEFSELEKFIDTPVKRYSSGMYVKLAFSVAAHLNSDIMIMDEVLAVGDVDFQKKCLGRMGEAAAYEDRTVLYVSHNISTVKALCTRCLVLDHGRISYIGNVEEAISRYLGLLSSESVIDFDLNTKTRRIDTQLTSGIRMQRALLQGKEKNIYQSGEPIVFVLTINCKKPESDVFLGFTNMYVDGTRIGGTTSNIIDLNAGLNDLLVSVPTDAIPDGVYTLEITVNKYINAGNNRLDSCKQAIAFSVINKDETFGSNWEHNVFGHTMYRNAKATVES